MGVVLLLASHYCTRTGLPTGSPVRCQVHLLIELIETLPMFSANPCPLVTFSGIRGSLLNPLQQVF